MSESDEQTKSQSSIVDPSVNLYHSTHVPRVDRDAPGAAPLYDTATRGDGHRGPELAQLSNEYYRVLDKRQFGGQRGFRLIRPLGKGGQGRVFLTRCRGADGFSRAVALKVFSPEPYNRLDDYLRAMRRIANVVSLVARGYHDHLVDVQRFHKRNEIRIMLMEWIDGYDLRRLSHLRLLERFRGRASAEEWDKINAVVVATGPQQSLLHPGAAITIVRDCLDGLKILHRMGILHGDLKPANIMLRRSGRAKIIDFGSAVISRDPPKQRVFTPAYAAPEVLTAKQWTPQSDLASLGYVVIELLAGQRLFPANESIEELLARKHSLPDRLPQLLPERVTRSERLMAFLHRLVAIDPEARFMSAEQADLDPDHGAYAFLQELARGKLDAEWRNDLGIWVDRLKR